MRPLSRDYDADPRRFLATDEHPHDDVHAGGGIVTQHDFAP